MAKKSRDNFSDYPSWEGLRVGEFAGALPEMGINGRVRSKYEENLDWQITLYDH